MTALSRADRERIRKLRGAESLAALEELYDVPDEHEAYFAAKDEWRRLRALELGSADIDPDPGPDPDPSILPGATVRVGTRTFHVHGVTHAGTDAERDFLREHVRAFLDAGDAVYCEQGIRGMYFQDFAGACEMDDYRWALRECARRGFESYVDQDALDSLAEGVGDLAAEFRDAAFSLVDASGNRFGDRFERALGSVASEFFQSHADHATGSDFASFRLRERAANDPSTLWRLQRYYECEFLPQPLEREWLRRHDPELELFTHARNARMADYAVYHADGTTTSGGQRTHPRGDGHDPDADDSSTDETYADGGGGGEDDVASDDDVASEDDVASDAGGGRDTSGRGNVSDEDDRGDGDGRGDVHLVVGAAHQPGIRYYLERHRDGDRVLDDFEVVLE